MVIKILLVFLFLSFPFLGYATQEISVSPAFIDEVAEVRNILNFSIEIKNETDFNQRIYPLVADILKEGGRQQFQDASRLSRPHFLSEWIEVSRSRIELAPKEKREIPITITVNTNSEPGNYYGLIAFARGATRDEATRNAEKSHQPELFLRIEVRERIIERAQLKRFQMANEISLTTPVDIFLDINNIGNKEITPKGTILIYDRNNREVASLEVNPEKKAIERETEKVFKQKWSPDSAFGRYRAVLLVEYGEEIVRDLQSTFYFWVIPWQFLAFFGFLVLALILILFFILKKLKEETI